LGLDRLESLRSFPAPWQVLSALTLFGSVRFVFSLFVFRILNFGFSVFGIFSVSQLKRGRNSLNFCRGMCQVVRATCKICTFVLPISQRPQPLFNRNQLKMVRLLSSARDVLSFLLQIVYAYRWKPRKDPLQGCLKMDLQMYYNILITFSLSRKF